MRRVLLFLLLWFDTVPARRIFAHLLHGTNCTARLHKDECIVNPLFMQDQVHASPSRSRVTRHPEHASP